MFLLNMNVSLASFKETTIKLVYLDPEIYIQSASNNSNETFTLMCLGRTGHFGQS